MNPESIRAEVEQCIRTADEAVQRFVDLPDTTPMSDVIGGFDSIQEPLDEISERIHIYASAHPEREIRDAAEELEQEMLAYQTQLSLRRDLFDRLAALDPADAKGADEARLLEHALRDFRRAGVDRDEETRERVRALQDELVLIGQEFDRNIVNGSREVRVEDGHAGLAGLPDDYLASHAEAEDGTVTLTTDAPDLLPVMLYARDGELRRALHHANMNRAWPENGPTLDRLLAKRHELATLLGYASWAEYITEDKMVRNASTARGFVQRVSELARPIADAEYAELLDEKRRDDPDATGVEPHESRYLIERVKLSRFGFDSQAVRPYFAYDKVKAGVLATSARLFGVEFERVEGAEVWHEDVECWDILDGGEPVARFYLDMFPRDGKYKHAAMYSLRRGLSNERLPVAALLCNFPRPDADDPALLLHSQVTTFFHEFGHLLHHLFAGRQDFMQFSGIATEWDFVEVPSQMFEEWAWDTGVLQTFATHHETGEPIPAELVKKLRAAEEYGKGIGVTSQMFFAMLSLTYYDRDPAGLDTTAMVRELQAKMTPFEYVEDTHFQAGFGHLHGYSAIYYTYMWSLVISKDLFGAFAGDPMDTATANDYRRKVLAAGGARDAADLVRDFLGRDYGFEAWEAWLRT